MKQTDIMYNTSSQPRQIRLDSTTRCNASCRSCHRFISSRQGEMPPDLILRVLDDVSKWDNPLNEIIPVNYGEIFARKDWLWILQAIEKKLPNTQIVIPTNGGLLSESKVNDLCSISTVKIINFSVNAYFEDTYTSFMGLDSSNIQKIKHLIARIKALRPDITIWASMVFDPMYQTDLEKDLFISEWKQYGTAWILSASSASRLNGLKPIPPVKLPCRSIFSDFVIGFDKKLSSCCFDSNFSLDLGELNGSVKEAWLNPKLEALRLAHNEHRRMEYGICRQCTFA